MTKTPVYNEPIGVRTPLALLTAPRDNEPVPGNPWANELTMFDAPIANSSCVASTDFPFAIKDTQRKLAYGMVIWLVMWACLPNALQTAIFSSNAINGMTMSDEPIADTISLNVSPFWISSPVVSLRMSGIENGGNWKSGIPGGISPIKCKSRWPDSCKMYAIKPVTTTSIAFLAVPTSQNNLLTTRWQVDFIASSAGPNLTETSSWK